MFVNELQRRGLPNLAENYSILNTNIQYVENISKAGDEDFKSLLKLEKIEIESILYNGGFSRIFKVGVCIIVLFYFLHIYSNSRFCFLYF